MPASIPNSFTYLALGSNLNRPHWQLRRAYKALRALPGCKIVRESSIYRSSPLGPAAQGQYLNAVIAMRCTLPPLRLLKQTQAIESASQRRRRQRWGPRSLDIDILLMGRRCWRSRRLHIPHPRIQQRNFVLQPLLEIAPGLRLPNGDSLQIRKPTTEKVTQTKLRLRD